MPSERDKASENPYEASPVREHVKPMARKRLSSSILTVSCGITTLVLWSITAIAVLTFPPAEFASLHYLAIVLTAPAGLITATLTLLFAIFAIAAKG